MKDTFLPVGFALQGFQQIPIPGRLFVSYSGVVVAWIDMEFCHRVYPKRANGCHLDHQPGQTTNYRPGQILAGLFFSVAD
jgi:hypothetical protein